jgi:hypothetical protein
MDTRGIHGVARAVLGIVALALTGLGAYATLETTNGAGAAALVGGGIVLALLALIGRWPSTIRLSGNEMSWEKVDATVQSQIAGARASGEQAAVVDELVALGKRIDELRRTGSVPEHPAETYDRAVEAALRRIVPGAEIKRSRSPRLDIADFTVVGNKWRLEVETKWRTDAATSYRGTTLEPLIEALPDGTPLLVVVHGTAAAIRPALAKKRPVGDERLRIVAWRDQRDDARIEEALRALVGEGA